MSFTANLTRFTNGASKKLGLARRGIILKTFSGVVLDTLVGNVDDWNISDAQKQAALKAGYVGGRLRGNWQTNVGSPKTQPIDRDDKSGQMVITEIMGNLGRLGETVYFTNNLPYAKRVEFEGWSHTKAPQGMVIKNLKRVDQITKAVVGGLKNL